MIDADMRRFLIMDMQNPANLFSGECIGKVMNFYRRQSNLSQQVVAGLLSVPYKTYRKYEKGVDPIPHSRLSAFLQHLKISPAEFEATLADIHCDSPADVPEEILEDTLFLVDSFSTLDRKTRSDLMETVRIFLENEMRRTAVQSDEKPGR